MDTGIMHGPICQQCNRWDIHESCAAIWDQGDLESDPLKLYVIPIAE